MGFVGGTFFFIFLEVAFVFFVNWFFKAQHRQCVLRVARAPSRLSPVASAASHRPKLRVGPGRGARRPPPDPASPVSINAGFSTSSSAHPSSAAG